jgi:hypothetical protein
MLDRFSIRVELNADAISHRNAVFHIEKELSHGQSSIALPRQGSAGSQVVIQPMGKELRDPGDGRGCLRWCHQLALKPRVSSWRYHRINQLDHDLVDVIASGALKRPDIEARGARRNPRQHRCCLASRT